MISSGGENCEMSAENRPPLFMAPGCKPGRRYVQKNNDFKMNQSHGTSAKNLQFSELHKFISGSSGKSAMEQVLRKQEKTSNKLHTVPSHQKFCPKGVSKQGPNRLDKKNHDHVEASTSRNHFKIMSTESKKPFISKQFIENNNTLDGYIDRTNWPHTLSSQQIHLQKSKPKSMDKNLKQPTLSSSDNPAKLPRKYFRFKNICNALSKCTDSKAFTQSSASRNHLISNDKKLNGISNRSLKQTDASESRAKISCNIVTPVTAAYSTSYGSNHDVIAPQSQSFCPINLAGLCPDPCLTQRELNDFTTASSRFEYRHNTDSKPPKNVSECTDSETYNTSMNTVKTKCMQPLQNKESHTERCTGPQNVYVRHKRWTDVRIRIFTALYAEIIQKRQNFSIDVELKDSADHNSDNCSSKLLPFFKYNYRKSSLLQKSSKTYTKVRIVQGKIESVNTVEKYASTKTKVSTCIVPKSYRTRQERLRLKMQKLSNKATIPFRLYVPKNPHILNSIMLLDHKRKLEAALACNVITEKNSLKIAPALLKPKVRNPLAEEDILVPDKPMKDFVYKALLTSLCHAGFTYSRLEPLNVLADVTEEFITHFCKRLKSVAEKEMACFDQGFPDPLERVLMENGYGGVRGLQKFNQDKLVDPKERLVRICQQLQSQIEEKASVSSVIPPKTDPPGFSNQSTDIATVTISDGDSAGPLLCQIPLKHPTNSNRTETHLLDSFNNESSRTSASFSTATCYSQPSVILKAAVPTYTQTQNNLPKQASVHVSKAFVPSRNGNSTTSTVTRNSFDAKQNKLTSKPMTTAQNHSFQSNQFNLTKQTQRISNAGDNNVTGSFSPKMQQLSPGMVKVSPSDGIVIQNQIASPEQLPFQTEDAQRLNNYSVSAEPNQAPYVFNNVQNNVDGTNRMVNYNITALYSGGIPNACPPVTNTNTMSQSKLKLKETISSRNLIRLNFLQAPSSGESTVLLSSSPSSSEDKFVDSNRYGSFR